LVCTYVTAALCTAAFRFPIPFGGYVSGVGAIPLSAIAVTFYGTLGGFVLQALLGAGAGVWASRQGALRGVNTSRLCLWAATGASVPGVLLLVTLDWFIGPW
jgi:hypothetical protein